MKYRNCIKKLFNTDRKTLYFVLSITVVCIFTLTIAYAALSTVLEIHGNAEVSAANWDIHLDNVKVDSGSVGSTVPTITSATAASFSATLNNPGDYYQFTIDVVNDGAIDAMIDSVTKMPELTSEQAKYINYIVTYENGELITTKQLVKANSFVRLKVKVEFRKDIMSTDLPSTSETLNLSFKINYVQSDDSNDNILIENNGKFIKIVSGDGTKTSDEVCIGKECFYVISSNNDSVVMLAKYNLLVGNKYDDTNGRFSLENATGRQDITATAWFDGYSAVNPIIGGDSFSDTNYWSSTVSVYPSYVYNENSKCYEYIERYKDYLEKDGLIIEDARLITNEELENLGCVSLNKSCSGAPSWVYSTSYWSGDAASIEYIWGVLSNGYFDVNDYNNFATRGVRPVIVISKGYF